MRVSSPSYPELLLRLPSGCVIFNGGEAKVNDRALEKEVREYIPRGLGVGVDLVILDDPTLDESEPRTGQKK